MLYALYRLHLIDEAIADIRRKAASLNPGRMEHAHFKDNQAKYEQQAKALALLKQEQTKLEDKQRFLNQRLTKIDQELYRKGASSRDIETLQNEIPIVKKEIEAIDEQILQYWDQVPKAEQELNQLKNELDIAKKSLDDKIKEFNQNKIILEGQYKKLVSQRPEFEKRVDERLLSQYNLIKKRHGDTGMSVIQNGICSACKMILPEKILESARDEKITTCPSCHKILYFLHSHEEKV